MFYNNIEKYNIILASKSPRRKQLLEELGINFTIQSKDIDESYPSGFPKDKVAQYLSEIKAAAFKTSEMKDDTLVITADTTVLLGKTIIGKPSNYQSAANMLRNLSGKKHTVITGVTFRIKEKRHSFSDITDVYFKRLSNSEIDFYINNYKPFDKAGAYGIQEWIGHIGIKKIEGSYSNVMGLPTQKFHEEFQIFIGDKKKSIFGFDL